MRLHLLPPSSLSREQKALYDDIMGVVNENFGSFVTAREDGALIGPFNAMVHFPEFGRAAWAMNKAMYEHTTLPKSVLQVAMLVTGTRLGARYQSRAMSTWRKAPCNNCSDRDHRRGRAPDGSYPRRSGRLRRCRRLEPGVVPWPRLSLRQAETRSVSRAWRRSYI